MTQMHYSLLMVYCWNYAAWIQVSEGNVPVTAVIKTTKRFQFAGAIFAESNCWSMLKGGITADTSGPAELYFEVFPMVAQEWNSLWLKFHMIL